MLKYQVESLEGINETAQAFYKEQDGGGYVLQVEGVVSQAKYDQLNQAKIDSDTEAKRRRGTVERALRGLEIESADELDSAIEALKSGKGKASKEHEEIIAQIKAEAEKRVSEADKRFRSVLMNGAVAETRSALQSAGFPAKVADMLAKTSQNRLSVDDDGNVRIIAENGNPLAGSGSDGYATYADLAKELAAAMPELLIDAGKGGGGKPPASSGSGKSGSITAAELSKMSPRDKAAYFKANPGVTVTE